VLRDKLHALFISLPQIGPHKVSTKQILQYSGSFVGKDYKAIVQLLPMLFTQIVKQKRDVTETVIDVYKNMYIAVARLCKLCYLHYPDVSPEEIASKMMQNIEMIFQCINSHFISLKMNLKIHMLRHLPETFLNYGPLYLYDAEGHEKENGTVRHGLDNSNRQNPSRDVANIFSINESVSHILKGRNVKLCLTVCLL
jgi:hypothetical protein